MNELVNQIAQRTGIGEDKARQAAEVTINFLRSKFPTVGAQLESMLQGGGSGMEQKVEEGLGNLFGKKSA